MAIYVGLMFCFVTLFTTTLCEEPHCSRYHYEEQTLAKLLRLEFNMEQIIGELKQRLTTNEEKLLELETKQSLSDTMLERIVMKVLDQLSKKGKVSSTYVRWGREDCPGNGTEMLYKGFMAGNKWNEYGGGTNSLCLPETPSWAKYLDGNQSGAKIYGTEIEINNELSNKIFGAEVSNNDLSCAMCTSVRDTVLMIPGHSRCLPGWTEEYSGYLAASHGSWKASSDFVCLDGNFLKFQARGDNEHVIRVVEAQCGALKCSPYVQGREIACVVCTK